MHFQTKASNVYYVFTNNKRLNQVQAGPSFDGLLSTLIV